VRLGSASSYFEDDESIAKQVALIHEDTAGSATFRPVFVNIAASGRTYRPMVLNSQSPLYANFRLARNTTSESFLQSRDLSSRPMKGLGAGLSLLRGTALGREAHKEDCPWRRAAKLIE
jgi:hypothetical protein